MVKEGTREGSSGDLLAGEEQGQRRRVLHRKLRAGSAWSSGYVQEDSEGKAGMVAGSEYGGAGLLGQEGPIS